MSVRNPFESNDLRFADPHAFHLANQISGRGRDHDATAGGSRCNPCGLVHRKAEEIICGADDLAGMNANTNGIGLCIAGTLEVNRSAYRRAGGFKDQH